MVCHRPCIPLGFDRKRLSDTMHSLAQKVEQRMLQKIGKGVVTLGVDGWTNTRRQKMYNVVLVSNNIAYFVDSMETTSNSADQIYGVVKEVKSRLETAGVIIGGVVGDNHSGVQSALNRYAM